MTLLTTSTTAAEILPRNLVRKSLIFQNTDSSINMFVKKERLSNQNTVSGTDFDHRVGPGGSLSLNQDIDGREAIESRWTVVAASGTPILSFFETEDITR